MPEVKLSEVKFVKFSSKRRFGVEMEVNERTSLAELAKIVRNTDKNRQVQTADHYVHSVNNNYWHVKFDRSCSDVPKKGGWEVASFIASGYRDIDKIAEVAKALQDAGVQVNDKCALHIHGEGADFNSAQVAALVANWMKIEYVVADMVPRHRRNGVHSRLLTKKYGLEGMKLVTSGERELFMTTIVPKTFSVAERRMALNVCPYFSDPARRTIELRLPEGTLDHKDVKNWIRLYLLFMEASKKLSYPENLNPLGLMGMLKMVGLHNDKPFFLLSRAMRETKMWVARRILKFSGKRMLREEAETLMANISKPKEKKELPPPKEAERPSIADDRSLLWWRNLDRQVRHNDDSIYEDDSLGRYRSGGYTDD